MSSPPPEMQLVRLPGRGGVIGSLVVALAGAIAAAAGAAMAMGVVTWVGIVVGTLAAFLALGSWLVGKKLSNEVEQMRRGQRFGGWGGEGRPRVDVGAKLTIVDGVPKLYAFHFERALAVELRASELVFRVLSNDGNGSVEVACTMPFAPSDREAARQAGEQLAQHHGVELVMPS